MNALAKMETCPLCGRFEPHQCLVKRANQCQVVNCENDVAHPGDLACPKCLRELEGWLELLSIAKP